MINLSNIISYGRGTLPNLIEIVSFSDKDILDKVKKNGYYTLNGSAEELEKSEKELKKNR